jgi:hypothetical protein
VEGQHPRPARGSGRRWSREGDDPHHRGHSGEEAGEGGWFAWRKREQVSLPVSSGWGRGAGVSAFMVGPSPCSDKGRIALVLFPSPGSQRVVERGHLERGLQWRVASSNELELLTLQQLRK